VEAQTAPLLKILRDRAPTYVPITSGSNYSGRISVKDDDIMHLFDNTERWFNAAVDGVNNGDTTYNSFRSVREFNQYALHIEPSIKTNYDQLVKNAKEAKVKEKAAKSRRNSPLQPQQDWTLSMHKMNCYNNNSNRNSKN
jgi:hypothetical protein